MMRFFYHTGCKIAACFLVVFCGMIALVSGAATIYAYEYRFFEPNPAPYAESLFCHTITSEYAFPLMDYLQYGERGYTETDFFDAKSSNLRYLVKDSSGNVLLTTLDENENVTYVNDYVFMPENGALLSPTEAGKTIPAKGDLILECYILDSAPHQDHYSNTYRLHQQILEASDEGLLPIFILSSLFSAAALIYLLCAAGHRPDTAEITPNLQDKIPYDLYLAVSGFAGVFLCVVLASVSIRFDREWMPILLLSLLGLLILLLVNLLTFATRVKLGRFFWQNTLLYRFWMLCKRLCKAFINLCRNAAQTLPLVWKVIVAWAIISIGYLFGGFVAFGISAVLLVLLWKLTVQLDALQKGGKALAAGDMEYHIETARMLSPLREHGEHLNSISDGLALAVEQKMKSERMKTDLITNVSHDINTPLTSIINYVDLLKKEELEGKPAEYIEVLDRQSQRLKKLTDDLVEASKASTGNLKHNLEKTDLCELTTQAIAEYETKLAAANLELIRNGTDAPIYAMADGALTWRIFSNLLNNICKYAQPHTRVYFDIRDTEASIVVSLKNISRDALNIPADELMERFVRGDSARHTEGSGLGLNIAQSLAALQNGALRLEIDGDLFKAELTLPRA